VSQRPFKITLGSGDTIFAHAVIVASGASAKWMGIESEQRLQGKGVSACATCDGFFFRGKVVAVVGGGDTAMEEASYLTRHASKVYLVHRRDAFRASKIMQERVLQNEKIDVLWNSVIEQILDDGQSQMVTGIRVKNIKSGDVKDVPLDGVFIAIGHTPNTEMVKGVLKMDENGYLLHHADSSQTDIEGIFVAGDVHDTHYKQAVTAAGAGCKAAIDAERWLEAQGHK
jgi:thioredoxin reductase (NADPH)